MSTRTRTAPHGSRRVDRRWPHDERGSVVVLVALTMTALIGVLALGVDIGALFNARSEAQRAADAAALAGASAFLEMSDDQARAAARDRAYDYATANVIRSTPITSEEVSVWVNIDSATVHAAVRRNGIPTWFARLVGIDSVDVGATATAWAGAAGAAQCVKPFAVPDLWEESTDDVNGNRLWDAGERWSYDPSSGDRYDGYSGPSAGARETGYGSDWRDGSVDAQGRRYNRDYGRRITIKVTDPNQTFVPSFFLPWVLPEDSDQPECGGRPGNGNNGGSGGPGGGGSTGGSGDDGGGPPPGSQGWLRWTEKRGDLDVGSNGGNGNSGGGDSGGGDSGSGDVDRAGSEGRGAAAYRRNICSCNASVIDLDTEYLIEPGNMVGPTYQGVQELINQDPGAYWDEMSNSIVSQYGMDSPRLVTVALFDPGEIDKPGRQYLRFNNFARVFIEEQADRRDPVTGRFLYYVPGIGRGRAGNTTGSLVRVLQLIR